jgi:hypothetical protein
LVARHAANRGAAEALVAHVPVALLAGNQAMLAGQRKVRSPVRVRLKQGRPALVVVTTFTAGAEFPAVTIAVASGTGVRHRHIETTRMTPSAYNRLVSTPQRKPGGIVVEAHLLPADHTMAGLAAGNLAGFSGSGTGPNDGSGDFHLPRRFQTFRRFAFVTTAGAGSKDGDTGDEQQRASHALGSNRASHGSNPRNSPWWKSTWQSSQARGSGR